MLSFLNIRAVVNGRLIYPLLSTKPVVIPLLENNARIVITDGYHITIPLKLVYKDLNVYCFRVACAISDRHLWFTLLLLAVLYLAGLFTGMLLLKVASFPFALSAVILLPQPQRFLKISACVWVADTCPEAPEDAKS